MDLKVLKFTYFSNNQITIEYIEKNSTFYVQITNFDKTSNAFI